MRMRIISDRGIKRREIMLVRFPLLTVCSGTSYLSPSQYGSRSLRSPGYPSNYPNKLDCTWIISTTPGNSVEITFSYFSTDSFDYLEIRDGRYSYNRQLAHYSGIRSTFSFTSSGTTLRIHFTSNGSGTRGGFSARYRRIVTVVPTTRPVLPYSEYLLLLLITSKVSWYHSFYTFYSLQS